MEMKAQPDIQVKTLEQMHSTDESNESNKPVSLSLLLESLAQSIAGRIEADAVISEMDELDDSQLEELISDYAKEAVEDIFDGATVHKKFLVEELGDDQYGGDNEEKRQARDQLVQGSHQSKEIKGSSQESGSPASTERPEVTTETADPQDKISHGQGMDCKTCTHICTHCTYVVNFCFHFNNHILALYCQHILMDLNMLK